MHRLETIQLHVWRGQLELRERRAWIDRLRRGGIAADLAIEELEQMELSLTTLRAHRDALRVNLHDEGLAAQTVRASCNSALKN